MSWLVDLLIGVVGGAISGGLVALGVAIVAAGVTTGVWNPKEQLKRVQDIVPKVEFKERFKAWPDYADNISSIPVESDFKILVRQINLEFVSSYPHPQFPPGSQREVWAALPLPGVPLLTRNAIVRAAIDKVRAGMSEGTKYPALEMVKLLSFLYWLLN